MSSPNRHLASLRAPELAGRIGPRSVVVLPLGAIEQHGPHLPVNTDEVIATATATALVERYGDEHDLWLLPTLPFTKSNEHAWSGGTVWLSATTLMAVLDDIARCVAKMGATKLVFLNAHGGNSALLGVMNREVRLNHGLQSFLAHPFVPADQGGGDSTANELGMGIHGGTGETSLMLHLAPGLVDMAKATRNVPEKLAANKYVRFGGQVGFGWLSNDFGPAGHIGDPTVADASIGARHFEAAVTALGDAMGEVAAFDFGR